MYRMYHIHINSLVLSFIQSMAGVDVICMYGYVWLVGGFRRTDVVFLFAIKHHIAYKKVSNKWMDRYTKSCRKIVRCVRRRPPRTIALNNINTWFCYFSSLPKTRWTDVGQTDSRCCFFKCMNVCRLTVCVNTYPAPRTFRHHFSLAHKRSDRRMDG